MLGLVSSYVKEVTFGKYFEKDLLNSQNLKKLLQTARERRYGMIIPMNANIQLFKVKNKKTNKVILTDIAFKLLLARYCCVC